MDISNDKNNAIQKYTKGFSFSFFKWKNHDVLRGKKEVKLAVFR